MGSAVTKLIESLPDRTGLGFGLVDFGIEREYPIPGENEFNYKHKQDAEKKNWYLY